MQERFWSKVNKRGPIARRELGRCWVWTGAQKGKGYGSFSVDGKMRRAHVVSFEMHHGPTCGLQVMHACDNRLCVRPEHLSLGTNAENSADRARKGRCWNAKLTPSAVREIRRRAIIGVPKTKLAKRFAVSVQTIRDVATGLYAHVAALALIVLSGCVPRPAYYAPFTCGLSHAEWTGRLRDDPNDPERLPWPVCVLDGAHFIVPPANPDAE